METNNTIKIFVDAHVFDGKFQGSRTFIKEVYGQLAENENAHLYFGACDTENLKKYFPNTKNVFFIKYKSRSAFFRLLLDIPAIIRKHQIRYAHFQYIAPVFKNCRFIITTHDLLFNEYPQEFPFFYRLVKNFLFKKSAKRADILTTVSEYSRKTIQKYFGIDGSNIHVVPNGVSNLFFTAYDKEMTKQYIKSKFGLQNIILMVSRLEPRKNHVLLLQAFLDLKLYEQGYHLVLLGWYENIKNTALDTMMKNLPENSKPYIVRYQNTGDDDLLQFYRAANIFVYPSKAEGFGIPPLEAAAVKIPVLCSNTSAMSDFNFFGNTHFNPNDYTIFKGKLATMLHAMPAANELERIAATVQQEYNWKKSAAILYKLIQADMEHTNSIRGATKL
jgi:glycosyltransferase involved in cell wall biosynthesis